MAVPGRFVALAVAVAYPVLVGSWVVSNPPGQSPDEASHFVKAVGLAHGRIGRPAPVDLHSRHRRVQEQTRLVEIPRGLSPSAYKFGCSVLTPNPASCRTSPPTPPPPEVAGDFIATYQPYLYLLPGLA